MKILSREAGDSKAISSVEAFALLERIREERRTEGSESFQSTLEYLKACSFIGTPSWAERVRKILTEGDMSDKEASAVINLGPERHTDAKALIPSLTRFDNYSLDALLNEISDTPNA
ncbi:DNA-directed RNA polymerase II subunit RPB4 [Nematocida displodere]|uniref:DNA-directed RNA polymerase II subunit RPB4 n=1 Tax=Nematocida displodere TaxID=1805483 RepID=A0A177EBX8_9MICR|nr:DNA-directed RNA polymerase II subunit RPB4 [Nematocida displodere]